MIDQLERDVEEQTEELQISFLPKEYIPEVWPKIRQFISNATKYTKGRYEPEDVLELLMTTDHLLWLAFKGKEIYGVTITTFLAYPRATYLSCPFVTGKIGTFKDWKYPMLEALRKWAKDNNCAGIESTARIGWEREFREDGYEALWQTFQLPLDDPRSE
jgi:hypothetical protein